MHAVVNHLFLNVPLESIRKAAQESLVPMFRELHGFQELNFVQAADDHLIVIIFWEDLESANHGASVIGPSWFAQNIMPHLKSEQQRSLGEVILQARP